MNLFKLPTCGNTYDPGLNCAEVGCTPPPPHCRLYSRYKKKMDDYECRFVSLQCHSPATAEVAQLRETLAGLAERSESTQGIPSLL